MYRTLKEIQDLQKIATYSVDGGDGVTTFNCASFYRWLTGIDVKIIPNCESGNLKEIADAVRDGRKHYTILDEPKDGCIVSLSKLKRPHHVGCYLYGGVWHCMEDGIVYSSFRNLKENGYEYEFGEIKNG